MTYVHCDSTYIYSKHVRIEHYSKIKPIVFNILHQFSEIIQAEPKYKQERKQEEKQTIRKTTNNLNGLCVYTQNGWDAKAWIRKHHSWYESQTVVVALLQIDGSSSLSNGQAGEVGATRLGACRKSLSQTNELTSSRQWCIRGC